MQTQGSQDRVPWVTCLSFPFAVGTAEPKSSNLCGNRAYGKSLVSLSAWVAVPVVPLCAKMRDPCPLGQF